MNRALTRVQKLYPKVTVVVDAAEPISVTVTRADSDSGHSLEVTECALAIACKREFKLVGAIIGLSFSYLIRGTTAFRFHTPTSVAREITTFDRHHDFAPGTYSLRPVTPVHRLGVRTGRPRGNANPSAKPRGPYHMTAGVRKRV